MPETCLPAPLRGNSTAHSKANSSSQTSKQHNIYHNKQQQQQQQPDVEQPRTPPKKYQVDSANQGVGTKSCFSIFGSSHKKMLQGPSVNSSNTPDSQPLVGGKPAIIDDADLSLTWEAFSRNSFDRQASGQWNDTADGDGGNLPSLLQPPKPTDRSHKQRLKQEKEKRKKGVYDGEMEPEGIRGQEAIVVGADVVETVTSPLRTFDNPQQPYRNVRNSSAAQKALSVSQPQQPQPVIIQPSPPQQQQRNSQRHLETITELSESRASDSVASQSPANMPYATSAGSPSRSRRYKNHSPSQLQHSSRANPVSPHSHSSASSRDPPAAKSFESNSTESDEDIERMMADFLHQEQRQQMHQANANSYSPTNNTDHPIMQSEYPNPLPNHAGEVMTMSKSAAARQRPIPITVSESSSSGGSPSPHGRRYGSSPYQQQQQHQRAPMPPHYSSASSSASSSPEGTPAKRQHQHSQRQQPLQNQHSYSSSLAPQQQWEDQQQQQRQQQYQQSLQQKQQHQQYQEALQQSQNQQQQQRQSPKQDLLQPQPSDERQHHEPQYHQNQNSQELPPHPQHSHLPPGQSVDAWNALALQHVHNGEYDMALAAFQHVLRAYKLQYGNVHPLVASAYHNLGTVHAKRAQLLLDDTLHQRHCRAQSLQCFQSAARAARDSLGRDHPNVAVSLVRIGFLLLQARQYNNAVITFQEALRIRQVHYGPHHALVANLYNNLGVCYMHLGQFAHGRDLLHHALTIQRTLLAQAEEASQAEEKKDGTPNSSNATVGTANQSLELADTLFNIGGLALEWIRRQGPDVRHAQDAEEAFEEAMELRKNVLGPKDPMVLQVKSLLDMARSIPRPRSPGRHVTAGNAKPTRGNGNVNFHPTASSSRPLDPPVGAPSTPGRKGDNDASLSPPRGGRENLQRSIGETNNNRYTAGQDTNKPAVPYRYYPRGDGNSPQRSTASSQNSLPRSAASSGIRYNRHADYLEPPPAVNNRRSLMDHTDNDGGRPEKPRHALSPTMGSHFGRLSTASSSASTVKVSPGRRSLADSDVQAPIEESRSVFRNEAPPSTKKADNKLPPPVMEVTVSQDEEDDGLYDPAALPHPPARTNVFISPHYVPQMSPHKVNQTDTPSSKASSSYSGMPVSGPHSSRLKANGDAVVKSYSYDAEESCVLTDEGRADSNNPLPDGYDALRSIPSSEPYNRDSAKDKQSRKIMVARPYRSTQDESRTSPTAALSSSDVDNTSGVGASSLYSSERGYSSKTTSYARDAKQSERSATLARAQALLHANREYMDSPQVQLTGTPHYMSNVHSPDRVKQRLFKQSNAGGGVGNLDEDLEDGLAPLGAAESGDMLSKKNFHPDMLSNGPQEHLREIYDEASSRLKNHHYEEAAECFEVILQCQRRQHGPFHPDVAAALHNCGLAELRAGNHQQALKSFEEAVRIRKGTLGKEHPHVAASLVKCGITFLLLHRYEEALWSFREALSVRKHALGTLHPSTARIYNNIGCVHVEFNELREARRAFEGALDIQRNALCHDPESGPIRFGAAATLCNLGYLYRYRGNHERAAQVLAEAADIQEDILGGTHPTVLSTLDSLAEAQMNSGQSDEAVQTLKDILERFRSMEPRGSRRLSRAEAGLQYKMSKAAKQMKNQDSQIMHLQEALQAVRSLDEQTDGARTQAATLEKRILSDLRDVRESMEANELKWV